MSKLEKFRELGLSEVVLKALEKKGFEEPSPIQEKIIPLLLGDTKDIIGQAQTGTGKTAAFGLPMIETMVPTSGKIQALVLTPTRELTIQVSDELHALKGEKKIRIIPIYGGQSIEKQIKQLKKPIDIVVGTPGRLIDHMRSKRLDLTEITYMILDEADEMLNSGFIEDIEHILSKTNPNRKTLLFSATMPAMIQKLAEKYMKDHHVVRTKAKDLTTSLTQQIYFELKESDKLEALCRIIDVEDDFYGLIFCRTKRDVDSITEKLMHRGYDVEAMHGDLSQYQRERVLNMFRRKTCNILVVTDVASRGLDIKNLSHVINFALPQDPESYVHRIGRTGRAGKSGTAITFITPAEYRKLVRIQKTTKSDIKKASVPNVKSIISTKKKRLMQSIQKTIDDAVPSEYQVFASELLEENSPLEVLSGILKLAFESDISEGNYAKIDNVRDRKKKGVNPGSVDTTGQARLFIAKGKNSGMTPKKLVQFIEEKSNVFGRNIQGVQVYDRFSFVTVSYQDSKAILNAFKTSRSRSIVEVAK